MKYCIAVACLLAVASHASADGGLALDGLVYAPRHASADYYAYPSYAFEYAVKDPHTGDNKAQWEKRDGDLVKGAYSLVEPDGSLRVVEYWADDNHGFNAVVKRLGPNVHPTHVPITPIYKAPLPIIGSGHISPISVGPIAKYEHLSEAPLITGPLGGAVSSISIQKPLVTIVKSAPILTEAILPAPIIKSAPILEPVWAKPILKPIHEPIIKSGPWYPNSYSAPLIKTPLLGQGDLGLGPWGKGHLEGLGHGVGLGLERGIGLGLERGIGLGHERGIGLGHERGIGLGLERGIGLGHERGIGLGLERGIGLGHERGIGLGLERGIGLGLDHGRGYGIGHGIGPGLGYGVGPRIGHEHGIIEKEPLVGLSPYDLGLKH